MSHPIVDKIMESMQEGKAIPDEVTRSLGAALEQDTSDSIADLVGTLAQVLIQAVVMNDDEGFRTAIKQFMGLGWYIAREPEISLPDKSMVDEFLKEHNIKIKEEPNHE